MRLMRKEEVLLLFLLGFGLISIHLQGKIEQCEASKQPIATETVETVESTDPGIKYGPALPHRQSSGFKRTVVAYNSTANQTDSTPCLSADGSNICQLYIDGENVCAANFVKLGTLLEVEGLGTCVVHDRMNTRFPNSVDWFMGDDVAAAIKFGKRTLNVYERRF